MPQTAEHQIYNLIYNLKAPGSTFDHSMRRGANTDLLSSPYCFRLTHNHVTDKLQVVNAFNFQFSQNQITTIKDTNKLQAYCIFYHSVTELKNS